MRKSSFTKQYTSRVLFEYKNSPNGSTLNLGKIYKKISFCLESADV